MSLPADRQHVDRQARFAVREPAIASERAAKRYSSASRQGSSGPLELARRAGFVALGFLMLLLGVIGAFLPVMPTTIFLILAAWFFGRSSPRLEAWMLSHPRLGPVIVDWREYGAVPRRAKATALAGMACGYLLFWGAAQPGPLAAALVAAVLLASAAYVGTRPKRQATLRADD
ncbi:MAG: hypothetical protein CML30_12280 [Rhizobiales bacterium]|nr:hypothetical protein [Hyphomicrobiales bacterium]